MPYKFKQERINQLWNGAKLVGKMIKNLKQKHTDSVDLIYVEGGARLTSFMFQEKVSNSYPSCDPQAWNCNEKWCGYYDMCMRNLGK